jgi:hypothetical protein
LRIPPNIEQSFGPEFSLPTAFNELAIPLSAVDRVMGEISSIAQSNSRYGQQITLKTITRKIDMNQSDNEVSTPVAVQFALPLRATFGMGDRATGGEV